MALNRQKGNMYGFISHTWNPILGKCMHSCEYCFMKRWGKQKPIRLNEKTLNDCLGDNNFIFVGSSTDMFADDVPEEWIIKVLKACNKFKNNKYLFQSKNTRKMAKYENMMPKNSIVATTIETNNNDFCYNAPRQEDRLYYIGNMKSPKMITIEPVIDFDFGVITRWMKILQPFQVVIGADSGNNNLPEPSKEKINDLIYYLQKFTKVVQKDNLKRLLR